MTTLMTAIKTSIAQQDTDVALVNCFQTWDNGIDLDVITGGICDRMSAMGHPVEGVHYSRTSLDNIEVFIGEEKAFDISRYQALRSLEVLTYNGFKKFFRQEEIDAMGEYLMNNFYH